MIGLAIRNTHSAVVSIEGDTEATDANGNPVALDMAKVNAEVTRLQTMYDAQAYARDRQYPPIEDQLDMIYHAGLGGDEFQATIKAVKDKYPKEA